MFWGGGMCPGESGTLSREASGHAGVELRGSEAFCVAQLVAVCGCLRLQW
jgi:hypothetical protein